MGSRDWSAKWLLLFAFWVHSAAPQRSALPEVPGSPSEIVNSTGLSPMPRLDPRLPTVTYDSFTQWVESNGVRKSKVKVTNFGDGIRGVVATAPITVGEVIIGVPTKLLITPALVRSSVIGPVVAQHEDLLAAMNMGANAALISLFLMYQRSLGAESDWHEYLELLPRNFTTPLFWEDSQLDELQSRELSHTIQTQRKSAIRDFNLLKPMIDANPDVFPEGFNTMDLFRTSAQIVITRYCELNVVGDRTVALAPMYDLPNHQPWTKTTFSYSAKLDMLQVVSGHRYKAGDQIFMSYGSKSNFELIYIYGIAFMDNPYGAVRVGIPLVPEEFSPIFQAIARYNQVNLTMSKLTRVQQVYTVPDATLVTLRILMLKPRDLERMRLPDWNGSHLTGAEKQAHLAKLAQPNINYLLSPQRPLSVGNELHVLNFLMQSLKNRYNRYNSTLAEDWQIQRNETLWNAANFWMRLAIYFRIDEKQTVLHMQHLLSSRRVSFLHDQLGGWNLPKRIATGSFGVSVAKQPVGAAWKATSTWQ